MKRGNKESSFMESSDCLMTLDIYLDSGCVTCTFPQHFSINILSGTNEAHIISLPYEASKCFRIFRSFCISFCIAVCRLFFQQQNQAWEL